MKSLNIKLPENRKPKYERIYGAFLEALKSGVLKPGERLPSSRELAKTYRCHRLTVMNALQSLVAEGWLEAQEKSHYFVSVKAPIAGSLKSSERSKKAPQFTLTKARYSLTSERAQHKIEFWGGQPDMRIFPVEEFRLVTSEALKKVKPAQLGYGAIEGLAPFRVQVEEYFRRTRSLTDKKYLITNGSQEGIVLIAQALLKVGDRVAVEAKGYSPVWKLLENLGMKLVPIRVDEEGLDTDELAQCIRQKEIRMIYVTPHHQYPTTVTLSPRRRQQLIQLAEKNHIPILEDDYDHEFHYLSPPQTPLAAESHYAIYAASFSKILYPGSRLGVIACHENLFEALAEQKYLTSRQSESLSQLSMALWMKEGGFERHLRRVTRIYEKRFLFMQGELEKLQSDHNIEWQQPSGGMCYWVKLDRNSRLVAEECSRKGIFFQNEKTMDFAGRDGTHLRIGFACVNEQEIKAGFEVLGQVLKKRK
jgi:GntR family transcriptional regulator/MocR family aminotransferase